MSKTQKSIVGGMTVLGITGIVCKLVGVLFSIPLTWLIGADGVALFQLVFPTYNLLLTVSSAGLPVAFTHGYPIVLPGMIQGMLGACSALPCGC